ncbi:MAG: aminotransferase class V-fold PLP-dependent enzyme, partial [Mariprofundaceae bacterium]
EENMRQGAANYLQWMKVERGLRDRLKWLVNAESSSDIALLKNTSEGLSLIAYGMDWQPGDNIVSTNQEFPSNRIVWESLKSKGVELRLADISGDDPEGELIKLVDKNTRLITVSSVQFATGIRMHLKRLGEFCRERDIFFCIDAIQSLGAVQFDVQDVYADAVVADAHKWLFGPEGIALFYISPQWREKLALHQFGWHMVERAGDFDAVQWQPAKSARRFEPGSPNMLGIHALNASLSLFEEIGMDEVEKQLLERSRLLMDQISEHRELELITPATSGRYAGIVTFRHRDLDNNAHAALYRKLMASGIICAHRAGGIRFSPHYYTDSSRFEHLWKEIFS